MRKRGGRERKKKEGKKDFLSGRKRTVQVNSIIITIIILFFPFFHHLSSSALFLSFSLELFLSLSLLSERNFSQREQGKKAREIYSKERVCLMSDSNEKLKKISSHFFTFLLSLSLLYSFLSLLRHLFLSLSFKPHPLFLSSTLLLPFFLFPS